MTTIFFMRHGLTKENSEVRVQGHQDGTLLVPETEHYLAGIVPLLRPHHIKVLISSDLGRAVATRQKLKVFLQDVDMKEEATPLLRERAMGYYEGMLWQDVPAKFQEQRQRDEYDFRAFGGEHVDDVRARVQYALRECARRYAEQTICCITHAGWLRQLVWLARELSPVADYWSNRTAIYQGTVDNIGTLRSLSALPITAVIGSDS